MPSLWTLRRRNKKNFTPKHISAFGLLPPPTSGENRCRSICVILSIVFLGLVLPYKTWYFQARITAQSVPTAAIDKGAKVMMIENDRDVCVVAEAMRQSPLTSLAYTFDDGVPFGPSRVPHEDLPHVSSSLCGGSEYHPQQQQQQQTTEVGAVLAFKAARTGSTFFTGVLTEIISKTHLNASETWEPYCRPHCPFVDANDQARSLHRLLTEKNCMNHNKKAYDHCRPAKHCQPSADSKLVGITAGNPIFWNPSIDFQQVFRGIRGAKIFLLRRTNMVLMAYSKHHHHGINGCRVGEEKYDRRDGFSFRNLLLCVEHYVLGNQEISASFAYKAALEANVAVFPIVYEDVVKSPLIVQREMIRYLGVDETEILSSNIFNDNAKVKKVHTKTFCDNADVRCDELMGELQDSYPCLYKQLQRESEGLVWTVPTLPNGTIHVKGDCKPVEHLSEEDPIRSLSDLYQVVI